MSFPHGIHIVTSRTNLDREQQWVSKDDVRLLTSVRN